MIILTNLMIMDRPYDHMGGRLIGKLTDHRQDCITINIEMCTGSKLSNQSFQVIVKLQLSQVKLCRDLPEYDLTPG